VDITAVVAIDETTLQATVNLSPLFGGGGGNGAAAPVQSVSLSAPSGWSTSTTNTGGSVTLTLGLPTGFSLPSNTSQANWDTAYTERTRWNGGSTGLVAATGRTSLELGTAATTDATAYATAVQGGKADTAVQPATLASGLAGKADLVGGLVPTSQIPAIAITEYLGAVGSQAAMLALAGQRGDWCLRTDGLPNTGQWILGGDNAALLSSWVQVPLPTVPVQSVNGQAGVIVLGTGDLAESGGNLFHTAARAIGAALTGFVAGAGTVAATDSILAAFQKVVGNIANRALNGAIGSSGLTMATARILGRSAAGVGAPEEFALLGLAFDGTKLATLVDPIIGLTTVAAGPRAAGVLGVIGDFPYSLVFTSSTAVPVFFCDKASPAVTTAIELDIRIWLSGVYTSIYSTRPSISVGANTSRNVSGGAFSTAFIDGTGGFTALTIPAGASVRIECTQFPSGGGGAGLRAQLSGRRAS
jgi:hypothetical protein